MITTTMKEETKKGITIELSEAIKEELQLRRGGLCNASNRDADDWDEVFPVSDHSDERPQGARQPNDASKEHSSIVSDDTPPPNLPVVWVNLLAVSGYSKLSTEEAAELQVQLQSTMHKQPHEFERSVTELFESGNGQHGTTNESYVFHSDPHHWVSIPYPPRLGEENAGPYHTAVLWKRLLQPHTIPVVNTLFELLTSSNHLLSWKYNVRQELEQVVDHELARRHIHEYEQSRVDQLEHLYEARDTLNKQLDLARQRECQLLEEREVMMQSQLSNLSGGLSHLDLNSNHFFAFPDQTDDTGMSLLLGLRDEEDDEKEAFGSYLSLEENDSEGYYESGEDERSIEDSDKDAGKNAEVGATETNNAPTFTPSDRTGNKRRRSKIRHQTLAEAKKEAEHHHKLETARKEEELVREACTTSQLHMASAKVKMLAQKLEQVDTMLESMQDEEWEAQEEQEEAAKQTNNNEPKKDYSLLDRFLATILLAQPKPAGATDEHHKLGLLKIHEAIKSEWKQEFGRLPPAIALDDPPPVHRTKEELGIVDCEKDNWEDEDSDGN